MRIAGTVQGVGFRPHVHHLATKLGLSGFVLNDSAGVLLEVEGSDQAVDSFKRLIVSEAPPLALIERVVEESLSAVGDSSFEIRPSRIGGQSDAPISPDIATCDDCLREISDPAARRFRYAFTNCTNCGPRFTITTSIPYDRANTTMSPFEMCAACRAEYEDPTDRRFHAQPIACPVCGPQLRLADHDGEVIAGEVIAGEVIAGEVIAGEVIAETARRLQGGQIIAIKGLGGYHLACDALNDQAVDLLRLRKHREEKPFAVMVRDLEAARGIAHVDDTEASELISRRRPIVLLTRREGASALAEGIAPGNRSIGVMLPYTPLHHLLMQEIDQPIVMTSGNISDEPIVTSEFAAKKQLAGVADAFLSHDRDIHVRCDDSVIRVTDGAPYPLRRARGYAPEPLSVVPAFTKTVLAAGAELKNTFCLGIGKRATLSHHIGDLESYEVMAAYESGVAHFLSAYEAVPEVIAHDLHPEYLSTKWALALEGVEKIGVQHHHAHIASCLADNGRQDKVIGLALDGTGYGDDGHIWGCEVLVCDLATYRRAAHLAYVPLPGGAAAIKQPWRMAAVYLTHAFGANASRMALDVVTRNVDGWGHILKMAEKGLNSPLTSSAGRLFDAAAAVCGVRDVVTYEGQAAAEFEQLADPHVTEGYPCSQENDAISGKDLIAGLADDLARGTSRAVAAARFHNGLSDALVRSCVAIREEEGVMTVALSGGTWQNLLLLTRTRSSLTSLGFEVLTHHRVPPNDGGISLGQAMVANASLRSDTGGI